MPQVRPFQFTGLPRFTAEQLAIEASIATYIGTRPLGDELAGLIGQEIERFLKTRAAVGEVQRRGLSRADLGAVLPAVGVLLLVGASPSPSKIIVDLDPGLANFAIERLLGGPGDAPRLQRPLTEIEEGVLSFILLKIMALFQDNWQSGRELALTLDRFANKLDDLQAVTDGESGYYMFGTSLSVGKLIGYVRILLPYSLITESLTKPPGQSHAGPSDLAQMRRVLPTLGDRENLLRIEAATIDLDPDSISALDIGDIILLDNHKLQLSPDGVGGAAFGKLGRARNGGLNGHIESDGEQCKFVIDQIVVQEEPQETDMADGSDEGDNLPETEGLLRDVPAPVVVELGRVRLNTAQVARLKAGQILRLPRGPNDPVDLVVNGKVFARGELIEVDGELGVRLVQMTAD